MNINWTPFIEYLAETCHFKSIKSKCFVKSGKDHHLAWKLFLTFFEAAMKEMVVKCMRELGMRITVEDFMQYYKQEDLDPNTKYLYQMCIVFGQAILNFRVAVRRNNSDLLHSAKHMSMGLFFGRNHPLYQQISLFDVEQYLMMAPVVAKLWDDNCSVSINGHPSKGQGFDYALEEKNREVKQFIPKNVIPSNSTWLKLCRNNASLAKLEEGCCKNFGCNDKEETSFKNIHCPKTVKQYRKIIRKSKYLGGYLDNQNKEHTYLSKKPVKLHRNLVNFHECAQNNKKCVIEYTIASEAFDTILPVFVTDTEEVEYKTKNIPRLRASIEPLLEQIEDAVYREEMKCHLEQL